MIQYGGELKSGGVIDLSENGIACLTNEELELDSSILLKINLSGKVMEIVCRVGRVDKLGEGRFRIFLIFKHIDKEDKKIIKDYIRGKL